MAEEKTTRWHKCFGAYKDKKNCTGCIEEADCKRATSKNSDAAVAIEPAKVKEPARPKPTGEATKDLKK